jgi:hypothetical protein
MGLLALAEPLPHSRGMKLLLLASWSAVALGVSSMSGTSSSSGSSSSSSGSRGGLLGVMQLRLAALARALLLLLPRGFKRRLPRRVLHWLGRGANVPGGLGLGVYLRQALFGGNGFGGNRGGGAEGLSLRFYDEAAVAEVLAGLGFSNGEEDGGAAGFRDGRGPQQQQQHVGGVAAGQGLAGASPPGGRVLRATSLGLSDDGGPGLPVAGFGVGGSPARPPTAAAAAATADFGGVLAPLGGRRS